MSIKPLSGYVLIEDVKDQSIGGLTIITDDKDREAVVGIVVEAGRDKEICQNNSITFKPSPVIKGDKIIYKKYHSNSIKFEGLDYKMVDFDDIIGVIK